MGNVGIHDRPQEVKGLTDSIPNTLTNCGRVAKQLKVACIIVPLAGGLMLSCVSSVLLPGGTLAVAVICAAKDPVGPVLSIAIVAAELENPHGD